MYRCSMLRCMPWCRSHSHAINATSSEPYRSVTLQPKADSITWRSFASSIMEVEMMPRGRKSRTPFSSR